MVCLSPGSFSAALTGHQRGMPCSGCFFCFLTTTRRRRYHHFVMGGISSEPKGGDSVRPEKGNFYLIKTEMSQ
jgi:hypothetical protein